jgi:hypothetical protein
MQRTPPHPAGGVSDEVPLRSANRGFRDVLYITVQYLHRHRPPEHPIKQRDCSLDGRMNMESTLWVSSFSPCERTANRTINIVHPDQLNAETLQRLSSQRTAEQRSTRLGTTGGSTDEYQKRLLGCCRQRFCNGGGNKSSAEGRFRLNQHG